VLVYRVIENLSYLLFFLFVQKRGAVFKRYRRFSCLASQVPVRLELAKFQRRSNKGNWPDLLESLDEFTSLRKLDKTGRYTKSFPIVKRIASLNSIVGRDNTTKAQREDHIETIPPKGYGRSARVTSFRSKVAKKVETFWRSRTRPVVKVLVQLDLQPSEG